MPTSGAILLSAAHGRGCLVESPQSIPHCFHTKYQRHRARVPRPTPEIRQMLSLSSIPVFANRHVSPTRATVTAKSDGTAGLPVGHPATRPATSRAPGHLRPPCSRPCCRARNRLGKPMDGTSRGPTSASAVVVSVPTAVRRRGQALEMLRRPCAVVEAAEGLRAPPRLLKVFPCVVSSLTSFAARLAGVECR